MSNQDIKQKANKVAGFLSDSDIDAIGEIASQLPDSGNLIELGSLFGKSATAWAEFLKSKSYTIYAVDLFMIDLMARSRPDREIFSAQFEGMIKYLIDKDITHLQEFKNNTSEYKNIKPIIGRSEYYLDTLPQAYCIFEDSDHHAYSLRKLPDWWDKILPGGILCGHDYDLPDVSIAATSLSNAVNQPVTLYENSSMWSIKKPNE